MLEIIEKINTIIHASNERIFARSVLITFCISSVYISVAPGATEHMYIYLLIISEPTAWYISRTVRIYQLTIILLNNSNVRP